MFKEIKLERLSINPFTMINDDWFLISAGSKNAYNTMTASWGAMGVCFNKNMITAYVRKSRYTYEFLEKEEYFTICFFDELYRHSLNVCGTLSGRSSNKVEVAGLTAVFDEKAPYFHEAKLVFVCKKVLTTDFTRDDFVNPRYDDDFYPKGDRHTMFMGQIVKVLINEEEN